VKVNVPSELTVIVPTPGIVAGVPTVNGPVNPAIVIPVTVRFCPSASESFVTRFPETELVSSVIFIVSSVAIGASLTAVIVIARVPVSVPPFPSLMV
jgi:hypothetical protein